MTGFEYTAAIGMLYEGMQQEGLEIIKNIHDRYDGQKRNPFDEAECGHHYARAMASWAGIIQQSGFRYSVVYKTIRFSNKEGNYFWSNRSSWVMCEILETEKSYQVNFSVEYGKTELKNFALGKDIIEEFKQSIILKENESVKFELTK